VDASDPYAAIEASAAPARPEPQAIKVEVDASAVRAHRTGRTKIMVLAIVTAIVGGFLGFSFGSGVERGKGADTALEGAKSLAQEVDQANAKIEELADVLKSARAKIADNKYPDEEVTALGALNIPFDGASLTGKGIGRFKPQTVAMLVSFAGTATQANEQKDKVLNVLAGSKTALLDFLSQKEDPQVRWSAIMTNGPYGPWARLQPIPTPFKVKPKEGTNPPWPEEFEVKDGDQTLKLKRYTKGEPLGSEPPIIPVDPTTQGSVCPSDVLIKLGRELGDLERTLRGDSTPGNERDGLLTIGQKLLEELKHIGAPGA
jgi:hypothetical protein